MDQKKRTKGRQKIAMAKIEKENDRYATFSKRRIGLFKKASELSTLCDADVGIFIFSPTGKPYSFFHPSVEAVLSPFQDSGGADDDASRLLEAYSRTRVLQLNQMLGKVDEELEEEEERQKELAENGGVCDKWWEELVENLHKEQLENLIALLQNMQSQLMSTHRDHIINI